MTGHEGPKGGVEV